MINLMNLPAEEAERLAYAEGFTGTAELFARVARLGGNRATLKLKQPAAWVASALQSVIKPCASFVTVKPPEI